MKKSIRLGFLTDENKIVYITVPDAPGTVPAGSAVKTAMLAVIGTGVVVTSKGRPESPQSARYTAVNSVELNIS